MRNKYKNKSVIYAPPESVVSLTQHNSSESSKHTTKGQVRVFKVDGKPVAYILGDQGYRTKDEVSPSAVRMVLNWFARSNTTYMGKVSQEEVEKYSD